MNKQLCAWDRGAGIRFRAELDLDYYFLKGGLEQALVCVVRASLDPLRSVRLHCATKHKPREQRLGEERQDDVIQLPVSVFGPASVL